MKWLWGSLAAVGLLVAAFSAGRFSAPVQTEVKEVEKIVYQDRVVEKIVTVKAKAETKIVYRDRVITKDGTVTEREVERTDTKEDTKANTETVASRDVKTETAKESKTILRPDWRVTAQVGAAFNQPLLSLAGPLVIGLQAERRIIGGVSAGIWANTYGAAGASLSVEF